MNHLVNHPMRVIAAVLIAASVIALVVGMPIQRISQIAIYTLYATGVNFLIGYLGLVPFGASFFFGCASYALAINMLTWGGNEISGLLFATGFAIVLALIVGAVILRRRGLYFALLTLACSQIAFEIAFKWTAFTGGENGLQNVPRPLFGSAMSFHVFTVLLVLAVLWALWRVAHSPFGRVMQALRDNEQRTASLGYNTYLIKLVALVIAGGVIGVAGGLMALLLQGAYANNLSWEHAGDPILMAALGGIHQFLGPLWGAMTFIVLEDRLSAFTENWWLFFAPIIIVFALLSPEGMQGIWQRLRGCAGWTLTRAYTPLRPARIAAWQPASPPEADDDVLLSIEGVSKRFGSIVTQHELSLHIHRNRLHSLVGPNGAGKTTLFNLLSGFSAPDAGRIVFAGRDVGQLSAYQRARLGLIRSFQILSVFPNLTAFENVRIAVQAAGRQGRSWTRFWHDAYADEPGNQRVWSLLEAVGLTARAGDLCSALSHGEKRLLEIAVSLAPDAKLLLLDEPLAGLIESDRQTVSALLQRLARSTTVFLIEHDIDRVLAISDRMTVLHQGRLIADGNPADVARHPEVVSAYLGSADHAPATPAVSATKTKAHTAQPCLLQLDGVHAGYDGSTVLEGVEMTVHAGEVLALLGRNGVGKTTLLRTITGALHPSAGRICFDGMDIGTWRPDRINHLGVTLVPEGRRLFPNLTVQENLQIAARPGGCTLTEAWQLFPRLKHLMRARAENLSGGERQMVAIARALMMPSRLILLDEPFEGLAPTVVHEVREAVLQLAARGPSLVIVDHHADAVLAMASRACVLVNGKLAFSGPAASLAADRALQEKLLGLASAPAPMEAR